MAFSARHQIGLLCSVSQGLVCYSQMLEWKSSCRHKLAVDCQSCLGYGSNSSYGNAWFVVPLALEDLFVIS